MSKVRILIVDDSAIIRKRFTTALNKFPDIEVVGTAVDPYEARDKIVALKPDVVTLDILMPRMDGLTFLGKLMKHFPLPIIMVSGATMEGGDITLRCLEEGAFDFVAKPAGAGASDMDSLFHELHSKIICAHQAWKGKKTLIIQKGASSAGRIQPVSGGIGQSLTDSQCKNVLIAIASSTGGTEALAKILKQLPERIPPIIISQHMPANFTAMFAQRLNNACRVNIKEAEEGEALQEGTVYIAKGGNHLKITGTHSALRIQLGNEPKVHHQRPAADIMFKSLGHITRKMIGVVLTGMGADGAEGLKFLKSKGAYTIAQDEASCIVFGMPKEAIKLGVIDEVLPLERIPESLLRLTKKLG